MAKKDKTETVVEENEEESKNNEEEPIPNLTVAASKSVPGTEVTWDPHMQSVFSTFPIAQLPNGQQPPGQNSNGNSTNNNLLGNQNQNGGGLGPNGAFRPNSGFGGGQGYDGYYETDRPDFRQPDFEELAMALPPQIFKALMSRDDLTCYNEASVLSLVEKYILKKPKEKYEELRKELIPVVRYDKLPADRLIQLSNDKIKLLEGYEKEIMDALCRKLKAWDQCQGDKFQITKDRNYYGPGNQKNGGVGKPGNNGPTVDQLGEGNIGVTQLATNQQPPSSQSKPNQQGADQAVSLDFNSAAQQPNQNFHQFTDSVQHVAAEVLIDNGLKNLVNRSVDAAGNSLQMGVQNEPIIANQFDPNQQIVPDGQNLGLQNFNQQQLATVLSRPYVSDQVPAAPLKKPLQQYIENDYDNYEQNRYQNQYKFPMPMDAYNAGVVQHANRGNTGALSEEEMLRNSGKVQNFLPTYQKQFYPPQNQIHAAEIHPEHETLSPDYQNQMQASQLYHPSQMQQTIQGPPEHKAANFKPHNSTNRSQNQTAHDTQALAQTLPRQYVEGPSYFDQPVQQNLNNSFRQNPLYQTVPVPQMPRTDLLEQTSPSRLPNTLQNMVPPDHQSQLNGRLVVPRVPTAFRYKHDFDKHGVMYYFGTLGYTQVWQNPTSLNQVRTFASTVGQGSPSDLVGRTAVNFRTLNQPYSYVGVQLNNGRKLLPNAYSLRNRNSTHHVLLNWRLEASNDLVNWVLLDVRSHNRGNEQGIEMLCRKGATSTWGIDPNICRKLGINQGFNTFRLVQTGQNSDETHNMSISGFELYGVPTNLDNWQLINQL